MRRPDLGTGTTSGLSVGDSRVRVSIHLSPVEIRAGRYLGRYLGREVLLLLGLYK